MGLLRVTIHKGRKLVAADINGKSDPYCLVSLRSGGPEYRTRTKYCTLEPVWAEAIPPFTYSTRAGEALVVKVFDEDRCKRDDPLGDVTIPLGTITSETRWFTLDNVDHGAIKVEIVADDSYGSGTPGVRSPSPSSVVSSLRSSNTGIPTVTSTLAPPSFTFSTVGGSIRTSSSIAVSATPPPEPTGSEFVFPEELLSGGSSAPMPSVEIPYIVHVDGVIGLATTSQGQHYRRFMCYQLLLKGVSEVFGTLTHGWNEKYDKAQKIFGSNVQASFIRGAIHVQHATLYKNKNAKKGILRSGEDFLRLLNYGIRDRTATIYTYVLKDNKFNFSETGASFFKVRYAGEFLIFDNPETCQKTLLIDNGSGTYAPRKENVGLMRTLFARNFPDLAVMAEDWENPQVKNLKKAIKEQQLRDWGQVSE
ncbi:C2 domain [Pelomyxa schiedti]|nr:C2 domain [Pelomyxa schiedti]